MKTNLSENRHLDTNYSENDAFDFVVKADAIRSFLEYNVNDLLSNKMIALYGNWGTGKTSLMRCISDKIDKQIYLPIFFEAWQFEKDENLAISLCDLLTATLPNPNTKLIRDFKEKAGRVLKGFASGLNIKLGADWLGAEMEFNGKDFVEGVKKTEPEIKSGFEINEEFKDAFRKIEDILLKQSGAQRILVFVDDLDRCEPENVLSLITALKLFFTYGNKSIFFCGLDKDAVTKAVITKYQDVIKSEEYLEKVFDISFHMPKTFSLDKLLRKHFGGEVSYADSIYDYVDMIDNFFSWIYFDNPRHVKKILNKYHIIKSFKANTSLAEDTRALIPDLLDQNGKGDVFETIFCLFFIVLYEFYPEQFKEIEEYERKFKQYINPVSKVIKERNSNTTTGSIVVIINQVHVPEIESKSIPDILASDKIEFSFVKLVFAFSSSKVDHLKIINDREIDQYENYFTDQSMVTMFCKFMIQYQQEIIEHKFSNYPFGNYFRMCKYLL